MVKLVALYRRPADPQDWMTRYLTESRPRMAALPGLERMELASPFESMALGDTKGDRRGPPFLMVELYFESRAAFDAAMVSDEGRAMLADMERQEDAATTLFLAEVD